MVYLTYILLFLILTSFSITLSYIFKKKIEECLFLTIGFIILLLFVCGCFINLSLGYSLLLIIFTASFIYNIYQAVRKKINLKSMLTPGYFAFILLYIVIIGANHGRLAYIWDEFSHWALTVKNMFFFDELSTISASTVNFKDYPPAISLFEYFAMKLNGSFNESVLYIAYNTLLFSILVPLFRYVKKIISINFFAILLIILLIPTIMYTEIYYSLCVDGILGVLFAGSLLSYFTYKNDENKNKFYIINTIVMLGVLSITKQMGLVLALITVGTILIDYIISMWKLKKRIDIKKTIIFLLPFLIPFILYLFWSINVTVNNVILSWSRPFAFSDIKSFLAGHAKYYQYETMYNFSRALVNTNLSNINIPLTFVSWVGIIGVIITLLFSKIKGNKNILSHKIGVILPLIGLFGYALILAFVYIFKFSEYEAVRLASYARYIDTYLLALLLLLFGVYLSTCNNDKKFQPNNLLIVGILLIGLNLMPLLNISVLVKENINETKQNRTEYVTFEKYTKEFVDSKSKLYFICNGCMGKEFYISKYLATPIKTNLGSTFSIGTKYSEEDVWTYEITSDKWKDILQKEYDYVYLYKVDEQFVSQFGKLFESKEITNNQLYRVDKEGGEQILKLVSNK